MIFILASLLAMSVFITLHILWCRLRGGGQLHLTSYFVLSFLVLIGYTWILQEQWISRFLGFNSQLTLWTIPLYLTGVFLYLLAIPFFLIFYHLVVIDSPTRTLLKILKEHTSCTYQELLKYFDKEKFLESRLEALIKHGYVEENAGRLRLTKNGLVTSSIYRVIGTILSRLD